MHVDAVYNARATILAPQYTVQEYLYPRIYHDTPAFFFYQEKSGINFIGYGFAPAA